jgi:hypothetical protein
VDGCKHGKEEAVVVPMGIRVTRDRGEALTEIPRMKYFAHPDMNRFKSEELDKRFAKVVVEKPKESRSGEYWPPFLPSDCHRCYPRMSTTS